MAYGEQSIFGFFNSGYMGDSKTIKEPLQEIGRQIYGSREEYQNKLFWYGLRSLIGQLQALGLQDGGILTDTRCCLCTGSEESRDHLLLRCEISDKLWEFSINRLESTNFRFHTWLALSSWLQSSSKSVPRLLRRLVAHSIIYHVWQERNNRLHNDIASTPEAIFMLVDRSIRDTILGKRKDKDHSET